jgi:hypothetical protein
MLGAIMWSLRIGSTVKVCQHLAQCKGSLCFRPRCSLDLLILAYISLYGMTVRVKYFKDLMSLKPGPVHTSF